MNLVIAAIEQSILFFPLALSLFVSYRVLNTTDLTIDGSFVLGAAVFARLIILGYHPLLCTFTALIAGMLVGIGVGLIQKQNKISPIVASILALFMLYSINFQVMGVPNISLLGKKTLLSPLLRDNSLFLWTIVCLSVTLLTIAVCLLLKTRIGLLLRAFGISQTVLTKLGQPIEVYRCIGLALSNSIAAGGGLLAAQINGYADLQMGFGIALTGIGSVVIGQQLISYVWPTRAFNITQEIVGILCGVFIYFFSLNLFLFFGIPPVNLKLLLGIMLVIFLRNAHALQERLS